MEKPILTISQQHRMCLKMLEFAQYIKQLKAKRDSLLSESDLLEKEDDTLKAAKERADIEYKQLLEETMRLQADRIFVEEYPKLIKKSLLHGSCPSAVLLLICCAMLSFVKSSAHIPFGQVMVILSVPLISFPVFGALLADSDLNRMKDLKAWSGQTRGRGFGKKARKAREDLAITLGMEITRLCETAIPECEKKINGYQALIEKHESEIDSIASQARVLSSQIEESSHAFDDLSFVSDNYMDFEPPSSKKDEELEVEIDMALGKAARTLGLTPKIYPEHRTH